MHKANLSSIPEQEIKSPHGRYHLHRRSISQALGGKKDVGDWGGGHPFDLEWVRLPSGAANFPYHAHFAQWEMYVFVSGQGQVRGPSDSVSVEAGDSVIFEPGEAHQIINNGPAELIYYVIANHNRADVVAYPDTPGKWGVKPQLKCFTMVETPYYEPGE
jgi:uncharacterized cupin superfamily protein